MSTSEPQAKRCTAIRGRADTLTMTADGRPGLGCGGVYRTGKAVNACTSIRVWAMSAAPRTLDPRLSRHHGKADVDAGGALRRSRQVPPTTVMRLSTQPARHCYGSPTTGEGGGEARHPTHPTTGVGEPPCWSIWASAFATGTGESWVDGGPGGGRQASVPTARRVLFAAPSAASHQATPGAVRGWRSSECLGRGS